MFKRCTLTLSAVALPVLMTAAAAATPPAPAPVAYCNGSIHATSFYNTVTSNGARGSDARTTVSFFTVLQNQKAAPVHYAVTFAQASAVERQDGVKVVTLEAKQRATVLLGKQVFNYSVSGTFNTVGLQQTVPGDTKVTCPH